jgi:WD40 repeat protein
MSESTKRPNPYPGPDPFQRGQTLYGRDQELRDLTDLLKSERIVLLYSPSGAGKTSLIQAALIPALEAAKPKFHVLPPVRVGLERPPEASGANRYLLSVLQSLEKDLPAEQQMQPHEWAEPTLEGYLERHTKTGAGGDYVVLVFDQFEEILTVDPTDVAAKEAFFREIGQVLRNGQRWALFAMREEFIAGLDPYLRLIPTRLVTTYRLDLLDEIDALDAIRKPAQAAGVEFTSGAGRMLVDNLRTVQVQRPDGSTAPTFGPYVEPVQLQVVCRRLWDGPALDDGRIDEADVSSLGDVDNALRGYYADTVSSVASETGVRERAIRDWVDRQLITEGGMRGQVLMGEGASHGLEDRAIWPLVDAHLVRAESRRGATWFELAHDRLIAPVRADNEAWRQRHLSTLQRQAALWAREERPAGLLLGGQALEDAEAWAAAHAGDLLDHERDFLAASLEARAVAQRERRQARRIRWLAIGASIASVLAISAFVVALLYYRSARHEAQLSLSRQLAAQSIGQPDVRQDLALLLALKANDVADTVEARGSLMVALEHNGHKPQMAAWARAPDGPVTALALSPNGKTLATGGGRAIQSTTSPVQGPAIERWEGPVTLWDVDGNKLKSRSGLPPLSDRTTALAFSPDGASLAAGDEGGAVTLWNLAASPAMSRTLGSHPDRVNGLVFSPTGRQLASIGKEDLVLWDLGAAPAASETRLESGEPVRSVAFSPAGAQLAVGYEDGRIKLWDIASGQSPLLTTAATAGPINSLGFSPDGRKLAAGRGEKLVVIWDLTTRQPMTLTGHTAEVESVAFSPDGRTLASGSRDKTIRLWDVESLKEVSPPLEGHDGWVKGITFSPSGLLVSAGEDGKVILWDIAATSRLGRAMAGLHDDEIWTVAASPDGRRLASGGRDGRVVLWDLPSGRPIEVSRGADPVRTVTFSPDGRTLAGGSQDGHITLWDVASDTPAKKDELVHSEGQFVTDLAFSPDGRFLASGSFDGDVKVWDLRASPVTARGLHHPKGHVWSVAFSPDGKTLASSDDVGRIHLWDVAKGQEPGEPLTMDGIVMTFAFSPDGKNLVAGNSDGQITIWDVASGREIKSLVVGHTGSVTGMAFSPDGKMMASSSYDGSVILWDVTEGWMIGQPLRGHDLSINGLAFGPGGRFLVDASDDRTLRVWNLDFNWWRQEACRLANRNLTTEEWRQYLGSEPYQVTCPDSATR